MVQNWKLYTNSLVQWLDLQIKFEFFFFKEEIENERFWNSVLKRYYSTALSSVWVYAHSLLYKLSFNFQKKKKDEAKRYIIFQFHFFLSLK